MAGVWGRGGMEGTVMKAGALAHSSVCSDSAFLLTVWFFTPSSPGLTPTYRKGLGAAGLGH